MSTRGAHILGSAAPPEGSLVAMNIDIPLPAPGAQLLRIYTEGRVVRVEPPRRDRPGTGFSVQNDRVTSFGRIGSSNGTGVQEMAREERKK